ncbi:hypothetical protein [Clostridium scatologenes]|uniref:Uncharacterized protein n=1 Tax=Clostridium scatologenes TaxID=1548 RepID=A0A0E3MAY8_CLOSL|nr:hypothetical protein [Clostridium scatologenes]AKA71209.1 hypothetical protein CSCA_4084 [Clostridium scatologenes]
MQTKILMSNGKEYILDKHIDIVKQNFYEALNKKQLMEIDENTYINVININEVKRI